MHDEKNLVYILTILENIEKIKIYSSEFGNADDFLWANQQLNFNGSVNLLITIGEESKKNRGQTQNRISRHRLESHCGAQNSHQICLRRPETFSRNARLVIKVIDRKTASL